MDEQDKIIYWWVDDTDNNCVNVESNASKWPLASYNYLAGDEQMAIGLAQERIRELENNIYDN